MFNHVYSHLFSIITQSFSGDEDVDYFICEVNVIVNLSKWNDKQKLLLVQFKLTEKANAYICCNFSK